MKILFICTIFLLSNLGLAAQPNHFRVLAVYSKAKHHIAMVEAATPLLIKLAAENNFTIDLSNDTTKINDDNLKSYDVFMMLHLAPFDMSSKQQQALQRFVESGRAWVGIHAAGLTGSSFVKSNYWQWFEDFMGGIDYSPHPAFQKGTFVIEDRNHPITKNLPERIEVSDEWYEFNESPRARVHVLAHADESTYKQKKPMGDHPIIWINEKYKRMVYIGIGHDASLCTDKNYVTLLTNAILWAGGR